MDAPVDRSPATLEHQALRWSMAGAVVLGALGISWGLIAGSQIVLFDGLFALIGLVLAWASLSAARVVDAGPTANFPFGREGLTPLVIAAQGLVLLGTCLYASFDSLLVIRDGGSDVAAASVLGYAALTLVATLFLAWSLRRSVPESELVAAEVTQWRAGALLSLAMLIGFSFALVLEQSTDSTAARYIDPALVLVACAIIVPTPVRMLRSTFRELLEGAPPDEVQGPVLAAIEQVRAAFDLGEPRVRLSKLGRKLYVEVAFIVADPRWDVAAEDDVRRAVAAELSDLHFDVWLNVDLSTDPTWAA